MSDIIEYIEDSLIQHGKENNRVYLIKLGKKNIEKVIDYIEKLSMQNSYTKIFTKVPDYVKEIFIKRGYIKEAFIPGFYKNTQNCIFMVKYTDKHRNILKNKEKIESILYTSQEKKQVNKNITLPLEFRFQILTGSDSVEIADLYKQVYKSYPFPIFDPNYINKTIDENVIYFGIKKNNKLVSLSSSEIDYENQNAEMTDFATSKDFRGNNFSLFLLQKMEEKMKDINIKTLYTIARSLSYGMNITFAKNNYSFGGTLINNTNIFSSIESMNVWYKNI